MGLAIRISSTYWRIVPCSNSKSLRSSAKTFLKRVREFLNPWGRITQHKWCFLLLLRSCPSNAKMYWGYQAKGTQKKVSFNQNLAKSTLSHFSCVWLLGILWTVALQVPLFKGFSRQEYSSGLPCPSGDLPDPGIEPTSLNISCVEGSFFPTGTTWNTKCSWGLG